MDPNMFRVLRLGPRAPGPGRSTRYHVICTYPGLRAPKSYRLKTGTPGTLPDATPVVGDPPIDLGFSS